MISFLSKEAPRTPPPDFGGALGTPADIAPCSFLCTEGASYLTGQTIASMAGFVG